MNVNRDDFYITLFSDASKEIYSLNSHTSFTNGLALPVDLGSTSYWDFGLAEISFKPPELMIVGGALVAPIGEENVFVYRDLIAPQVVGSELKSVLRTIIAPSQTGHHKFPNIYYFPVQKQLLTYVHIELALCNDFREIVFLDDATPTPTKVVLHFRRTKLEMLRWGSNPVLRFRLIKS